MEDEKNNILDTLAAAISENPQAASIFNSLIGDDEEDEETDSASKDGLFDLSSLLKMQEMLSGMKNAQDDEKSRLLYALKPFLNESRQKNVDSIISLLKIAGVLKLAGGTDLFKNFKL